MRTSAQAVSDTAPTGSLVAYSDGQPRRSPRLSRKLQAARRVNGVGRLHDRTAAVRWAAYERPASFALHVGALASSGALIMTVHKVFDAPPGGGGEVRVFCGRAGRWLPGRFREAAMGWLFMQSLKGHAGPRAYLDAQFTFKRETVRCRVLRSALVSMRTYYAAVETVTPDRGRRVCAIVCLVKYNPRDPEGYVFGYKDMDETMGPHASACPPAILDVLTPTDNAYVLAWRERCRAAAARRTATPKLRAGAIVVFSEPIAFSDGARFDRMTVVIHPARPRAIRFRP